MSPDGLLAETLVGATSPVAIVEDEGDLDRLHHPGCGAVIWQRDLADGFQAWMDRVPPDRLPRGRIVLRPDAVRAAVRHLCDAAGTPPGAERDRLCDDIAALAIIFGDLTSARYLRLRLSPVDTDACRRFHVDAIRARLVCTYRGPGTQYGLAMDDRPPVRISQVPTGAPIILRGTAWPGKATGVMHRSPPIEGTDITRLVLVLDMVDDPGAAK
ncbi:MAG: DUF1826 domain-containing protein [Pseudomonadota bacterium]